jgi:hypothetical protein
MKSMPGSNANYKKSIRANIMCSFCFKARLIHAHAVQTAATSVCHHAQGPVAHPITHLGTAAAAAAAAMQTVAAIAGFQ